jgi:hypothetical protein
MKNLFIAVLVFTMLAGATTDLFAQPGKISFGIGADVALPLTSGFKDSQNLGIGGTAKGYYLFNDMVTFNATAGYITFSGKDFTPAGAGAGTSVKAGSWSQIPVMVGARYYFSPAESKFRLYGAFEIGLIFSSYTLPDIKVNNVVIFPGGSVSGSDFSYQPQIGFEASKFDVAVRLLGVSGASAIAARVGYIFGN